MKRIAFCFDGTWNEIDSTYPTNVTRIAQSISPRDAQGVSQVVHYDEGVGTSLTEKWSGGMLGHGLAQNIIEAYHFLVLNYEPGDEIYVFGFSRGAYTARSFVGLIRNCGIISRRSLYDIRSAVELYRNRDKDASPNSEAARQFRFKHCPHLCLPGDSEWRCAADPKWQPAGVTELGVKYVGVWDTVGALGVPNHLKLLSTIFNRKYGFHDTNLSSVVGRARHAVSADERRKTFEPALWTNLTDLNAGNEAAPRYEQLIFPGTHSGVGGGGPVRGLSDIALEWIFLGAREEGLAFDMDNASPVYAMQPDHRAALFNENAKTKWSIKDRIVGIGLADRTFKNIDVRSLHISIARRMQEPATHLAEGHEYRPPSLSDFWDALLKWKTVAPVHDIETKKLHDDRILKAPKRVSRYRIQPGDTLGKIAERELGDKREYVILFLHNQKIGRLIDPDKIYVGVEIEIPEY